MEPHSVPGKGKVVRELYIAAPSLRREIFHGQTRRRSSTQELSESGLISDGGCNEGLSWGAGGSARTG